MKSGRRNWIAGLLALILITFLIHSEARKQDEDGDDTIRVKDEAKAEAAVGPEEEGEGEEEAVGLKEGASATLAEGNATALFPRKDDPCLACEFASDMEFMQC